MVKQNGLRASGYILTVVLVCLLHCGCHSGSSSGGASALDLELQGMLEASNVKAMQVPVMSAPMVVPACTILVANG